MFWQEALFCSVTVPCHAVLCGGRLISYPAAYLPLTGERGSFSLLDVYPDDSKAFYSTHPQARQVGCKGGSGKGADVWDSLHHPLAKRGGGCSLPSAYPDVFMALCGSHAQAQQVGCEGGKMWCVGYSLAGDDRGVACRTFPLF